MLYKSSSLLNNEKCECGRIALGMRTKKISSSYDGEFMLFHFEKENFDEPGTFGCIISIFKTETLLGMMVIFVFFII